MPVAPYTWLPEDFVTASRLMSELRQTEGAYFQPNGVRFHAQRPVYKAFTLAQPTATSGQWDDLYSATSNKNAVIADTIFTDPLSLGGFDGTQILNGSGVAGTPGGMALVWGNMPFATATGAYGQAGISTNAGHTIGTLQQSVNGGPGCWAIDLTDIGTRYACGSFYKNSAASLATVSSVDGSGGVLGRTNGLWASTYLANSVPYPNSTLPSLTTSMSNGQQLNETILNNTIQQSLQLLNLPPAFRGNYGSSMASATTFIPPYTPTFDPYGAWDGTNYDWTAPLPGVYLVASVGGFGSSPGAWTKQEILVNGSWTHQGPAYYPNGEACSSGTVRILSLNAGDTVQHKFTCATATASLANSPTFVILWLGANSLNPVTISPPDVTYSFAAGTPADAIAQMLNQHVFSDIAQLIYRPYAMAWQGTQQTGMTTGAWNTLNMDHYTCPVHADSGSLYGSWSNGAWTAATSGWYLVNLEAFVNSSAAGEVIAGIQLSTPGQNTPDYMNQNWTPASAGGGSTMLGLYYLAAGDTVTAMVHPAVASTYTDGVGAFASHMEVIWISE